MKLNKLISQRRTLNPAFKLVQPLPTLPRVSAAGASARSAAVSAPRFRTEGPVLAPLQNLPTQTSKVSITNRFCTQMCA